MTPEIMALVKEKYPEGYFEDDIIVFKNQKNETIEAIQVEAPDTIYLIKIGKYLSIGIENFDVDSVVDVDAKIKPEEIADEIPSDDDDEEDDTNDDEDEYEDEVDDEDEDEDEVDDEEIQKKPTSSKRRH